MSPKPISPIHTICDFIISEVTEGGKPLNHLKLQKLLYFVDAWYMAFGKPPLFEEKFQAWVHGPVSRDIYDRFSPTKDLYSPITRGDMMEGFNPESISKAARLQIKNILEVYAKYSGSELEEIAHKEEPWIKARGNFPPAARCENEIDKDLTKRYYARRLKKEK